MAGADEDGETMAMLSGFGAGMCMASLHVCGVYGIRNELTSYYDTPKVLILLFGGVN